MKMKYLVKNICKLVEDTGWILIIMALLPLCAIALSIRSLCEEDPMEYWNNFFSDSFLKGGEGVIIVWALSIPVFVMWFVFIAFFYSAI